VGGHGRAGHDGQQGGGARGDAGAVDVDAGETVAELYGQPVETSVSDQQVGSPADDEDIEVLGRDEVGQRHELLGAGDGREPAGPSTHPIGRQRADGLVGPHEAAQGGGDRLSHGHAGAP
jgi:hypothetical protein